MNKDYKLNVGEIFGTLCRHLTASNEIDDVSRDFHTLDTNLARVNYTHDLLQKFGLYPEYNTKDWKNDEMSAKYRESGNEMFKRKKYEYALELYTKSVASAKNNSEALSLAYANRSAVLFEREQYKECLEDIDRALTSKCPNKIIDKLTRRKHRTEELYDPFIDNLIFEEIPTFTIEQNPYIACAANYIALDTTTQMGRQVVATKDIQIGDVIAIEQPFAAIVLPEASLSHCNNCLKLCYNPTPCDSCNYALYCDEKCMQDAFNNFHKFECPIVEILLSLQISKLNLLALRVVFCASKEFDNLKNFSSKNSVYESGRYEEIHNLCSNSELRTNADLFDRTVTCAVISELVRKYTSFFDEMKGDNYNDIFKDLLLHHMQTAPSNFHEISELVAQTETISESMELGAGAYSFLSMLNHSCSPNVVRHCYGSTIVLRALSPIKKGQQLFDNYGYHYAVMPKIQRRNFLKTQYFFECNCEACEANWPLYDCLPVKNFEFEVSEDDIQELKRSNVDVAKRVLSGLLIKAAILDKMKPCKNLADIQECIKQCYSILGNKKFI